MDLNNQISSTSSDFILQHEFSLQQTMIPYSFNFLDQTAEHTFFYWIPNDLNVKNFTTLKTIPAIILFNMIMFIILITNNLILREFIALLVENFHLHLIFSF